MARFPPFQLLAQRAVSTAAAAEAVCTLTRVLAVGGSIVIASRRCLKISDRGACYVAVPPHSPRNSLCLQATTCSSRYPFGQLELQTQQHRYMALAAARSRHPLRQNTDDQKLNDDILDAPLVVQRVLEAAEGSGGPRGESSWTSLRDDVLRLTQQNQLKPGALAVLVAAFSRAGELTAPLATAVAQRFRAALRRAGRCDAAPFLSEENSSLHGGAFSPTTGTDMQVDFSSAATALLAIKDCGLLGDASVGSAAQALYHDLLHRVQSQWESLTFGQLRRVLLLVGATAECFGLSTATALQLLAATKKHLRKIQKNKCLDEHGDSRDSIALLWPLAGISAALGLPPPQNGCSQSANCGAAACSNQVELVGLQQSRDIVLHLLEAHVLRVLSSRLPCSPLDLALGFIGLERLRQQRTAEYVLAAFSREAAATSAEGLCCLAREILLAGAVQKALWDAFADAASAALEQVQQDVQEPQQGSSQERIATELSQWLRFCGRTI